MLKKILVVLLLFVSFFAYTNLAYAGDTPEGKARAACKNKETGKNLLHCETFKIDVNNFSPGNQDTLKKAREGGGNTKETTIILLGVIIKNMIIIFGVLSLFVMTIGGGFMIFHAGEESILTKGKTMLKYGIVSLALALASGVIVKIVNWLLY